MYEKRSLILAHQAYYHLLPCPTNCLFEEYVSSNDLRRKMTFKLPRAKARFRRRTFHEPNLIRIKADPNYLDRLN